MLNILGLRCNDVVDSVQLSTHACFLALLNHRQLGVDTLLTLVIIVLNVILSAVQKIEASRNNDSDDADGTVREYELTMWENSRDIDTSKLFWASF